MFQAAYIQSLADNEETVDKFLVNSHSDLLSKLKLIDLRNGWISHISQNDPIFFMKIVISDSRPIIERSISIDDELFVKAFDYLHNPILLSRISINDTRQIESLLNEVDKYSPIFEPDYSSSQISINNRQMSGSNYNMSYSQVLESERRLQLSNILKFFLH